jgi:hypothetical protein
MFAPPENSRRPCHASPPHPIGGGGVAVQCPTLPNLASPEVWQVWQIRLAIAFYLDELADVALVIFTFDHDQAARAEPHLE